MKSPTSRSEVLPLVAWEPSLRVRIRHRRVSNAPRSRSSAQLVITMDVRRVATALAAQVFLASIMEFALVLHWSCIGPASSHPFVFSIHVHAYDDLAAVTTPSYSLP